MATLKDIGLSLGLSPATVSRALNGYPEVSARTRARVQDAAQRLDYRPNQIAKKLVSGRSGMVGLILKSPADLATDPTFGVVVTGLSAQLAVHDLDLVFQVSLDEDEVEPYRRMIAKNTLDGFVLNAPTVNDARIAYLCAKDIPFVVHGRDESGHTYAHVDIDNYAVAARSVALLHDLGHRRIALLNGPERYAFARQRARGFAETLEGRGVSVPSCFITHARPSADYGYTAALRALGGALGPAPTAFVCASTLIAAGAYRAISDRGLEVGRDISVIAHDDMIPEMLAVGFSPTLSVTRAPLADACAPLAQLMAELLGGDAPHRRALDIELIVRQSTAPVPKGEDYSWT